MMQLLTEEMLEQLYPNNSATPEVIRAVDNLEYLTKRGVPVQLLEYGRPIKTIPPITKNIDKDRYGVQEIAEFAEYAVFKGFDLAIVAGNGLLLVRIPAGMRPQERLATWFERSGTLSDNVFESFLLRTISVTDKFGNTIYLFKYETDIFERHSKTMENGIQFLNNCEIIRPVTVDQGYSGLLRVGDAFFKQALLRTANQFDKYADNNGTTRTKRIDRELFDLSICSEKFYCYQDEVGTPLIVMDNQALEFASERVRDELASEYYKLTFRYPKRVKLDEFLKILKMITKEHGKLIKQAPFIRPLAVKGKDVSFAEQIGNAFLKMLREKEMVFPMRALEDATGIGSRVLGKKLNENKIRLMIEELLGLGYRLTRNKTTNTSVVELRKLGDVWSTES